MAVELNVNPPIESNSLSKSDVVDLLGEEEKKDLENEKVVPDTFVQNEKPEEKKDEKPEDEEEEIKVELEPGKEEELEFTETPKRQEILKKFPELFKTFPTLEKAIYREQQYTELFATPQEAKDATERLGDYEAFEKSLLGGDLTSVLKSVKESDGKAFESICNNYLPTLAQIDEKAYLVVLGDVLKTTAASMYGAGESSQNDNLKAAAQILHQFAFGDTRITLPPNRNGNQQPNQKEVELKQKEEEFNQRQLDNAVNDVSSRVQNIIKANVEKYIDPKGVMTDYIRTNAVNEVLSKIDDAIGEDGRFTSVRDRLWQASIDDNFSDRSRNKVRDAILNKTKAVLPDILRSVRSSALKGLGKGDVIRNREEKENRGRGPREPQNNPRPDNNRQPDRKLSTYEFLSQD